MATTFFHATAWKFHQPDEVIALFDQAVQDANVRCTYMVGHQMFCIECPGIFGDNVFHQFVDLCNEYIQDHQLDITDAFGDQKISPMFNMGGSLDEDDEFLDLLEEEDNQILVDIETDSSEHDDDEGKTAWTPVDPDTDISRLLPDSILQSIAEEIVCVLTLNVEKARVFITNATETKIQTVTRKLNNLERNFRRSRVDRHFMYMGNQREAMVQLERVQNLEDDTLKQTLVPMSMHDMLPRQRVVRMVGPDNKLQAFSKRVPENVPEPALDASESALNASEPLVIISEQVSNASEKVPNASEQVLNASEPALVAVWNSLKPLEFRGLDVSPLIPLDNQAPDYQGSVAVATWLSGVKQDPDLENSDMMGEVADLNGFDVLKPASAPPPQQTEQNIPDWGFPEDMDSGILVCEPTQAPSASVDVASCTPSEKSSKKQSSQPSEGAVGSRPQTSASVSLNSGSVRSSKQTASVPARPFAQGIRWTENLPRHTWDTVQQARIINWEDSENQPRFKSHTSINDFPPLGWKPDQLPQVQPVQTNPRVQLPPAQHHGMSSQRSRSSATLSYTADGRLHAVQSQHEEQEPDDQIVETLQAQDEVESRRFFKTTLHRKKKGKGVSDSKPAFKAQLPAPDWDPKQKPQDPPKKPRSSVSQQVKAEPVTPPQCADAFLGILTTAKSFVGHLEIEISIGGILMQGFRSTEARDFTLRPISSRRMLEGIQQYILSNDATLYFNERLTSSLGEACRIPVMRFFDHEKPEVKSWYEFHCEDKNHNHIIVKVTGPQTFEVAATSDALGQTFFHFPKHRWDARFAVQAWEEYTNREAISELIKGLSATVLESNDENQVVLNFSTLKNLAIHKIYSKRRVSHRYLKDERIKLNVTEVQEMQEYQSIDSADKHQAKTGDRSEMIKTQRLWFEARLGLSSTSMFDENVKLKTGDDATWQPTDVLDDQLLWSIQNVIDQFVPRLDSVGTQNQNIWNEDEVQKLRTNEAERQALKSGSKYW